MLNRSHFFRPCARGLGLAVFAYIAAFAGAQSAKASGDEYTLVVCNECSAGPQFSVAAIDGAEFSSIDPFNQFDIVYVVNIATATVQAYEVSRTYIDPDPTIFGDETFETSAQAIAGDSHVIADIADATMVVQDFFDQLSGGIIDDDELDNLPFDSALDLIGPEDSSAGLARRDLEIALSNFFAESWRTQVAGLRDSVQRVLNRFIERNELSFGEGAIVVVEFDDETTVKVSVKKFTTNISDLFPEIDLTFDTDEGSVSAPGRNALPVSAGQFDGFRFSTPNPDLDEDLNELIRRLGGTLSPPGGSSPPSDDQCLITVCRDDPETGTFVCTKKTGPC